MLSTIVVHDLTSLEFTSPVGIHGPVDKVPLSVALTINEGLKHQTVILCFLWGVNPLCPQSSLGVVANPTLAGVSFTSYSFATPFGMGISILL